MEEEPIGEKDVFTVRGDKPKKRKKKKKKKRGRHSSETDDLVVDKTSEPRKKKKRGENGSHAGEEVDDSNVEESLEGAMVNGEMVLIDRKSGKVYSGLERTEKGERIEIGEVSKSGSIVLNKNEKDDDDDTIEKVEAGKPEFPFETDADDHCESPLEAYKDIVPFLKDCNNRKSPSAEIFIYDPYFCNGAVVNNLKSLGFTNVHNRKEDCYKVWGSSSYPSHDILVTNPPYSGDHIELLMEHVTSESFGNRPWMLLMPQWVHKKDYYISKTKRIRPFYVLPRKRYVYLPPPSFRESKKSDVHKKSSPFVSMWFIWGGTDQQNERWLSTISRRTINCDVARSKSALRDLRRKGGGRKKK